MVVAEHRGCLEPEARRATRCRSGTGRHGRERPPTGVPPVVGHGLAITVGRTHRRRVRAGQRDTDDRCGRHAGGGIRRRHLDEIAGLGHEAVEAHARLVDDHLASLAEPFETDLVPLGAVHGIPGHLERLDALDALPVRIGDRRGCGGEARRGGRPPSARTERRRLEHLGRHDGAGEPVLTLPGDGEVVPVRTLLADHLDVVRTDPLRDRTMRTAGSRTGPTADTSSSRRRTRSAARRWDRRRPGSGRGGHRRHRRRRIGTYRCRSASTASACASRTGPHWSTGDSNTPVRSHVPHGSAPTGTSATDWPHRSNHTSNATSPTGSAAGAETGTTPSSAVSAPGASTTSSAAASVPPGSRRGGRWRAGRAGSDSA